MSMDQDDKKILESEIAVPVGRAVSQWLRKNQIEEPVIVQANVMQPTCYIDEAGVSHTGKLITVNCRIIEPDDDDDDYEY